MLVNLRLNEADYDMSKLYQYEYDALVFLLFNLGENDFKNDKVSNLLKCLNESNYQSAAYEF